MRHPQRLHAAELMREQAKSPKAPRTTPESQVPVLHRYQNTVLFTASSSVVLPLSPSRASPSVFMFHPFSSFHFRFRIWGR